MDDSNLGDQLLFFGAAEPTPACLLMVVSQMETGTALLPRNTPEIRMIPLPHLYGATNPQMRL
jgi:hypothetical protein